MKTLLATTYPTPWTYLPKFEILSQQDRFGLHQLCHAPDEADIILFVDARHEHNDWRFKAIQEHPFTRKYREKTFLYSEVDQPYCVLPGLYVSMPKQHFNLQRQRSWCYVTPVNQYVAGVGKQVSQPEYLFSFMGRHCHPVRDAVLRLKHKCSFIQDTSDYNFFGTPNRSDIDNQKRHYADILALSKFVLCPRGSGPASFRLFETMAAGRVPVIISDEWVPPIGPDWNACTLRVKESDVAQIPALVEANEARYEQMAQAARREWEQWFAPDVLFHHMVENCLDIMQHRRLPEAAWRRKWDSRYVRLCLREIKAKAIRLRQG